MLLNALEDLRKIKSILNGNNRGVFKRIDENRELLLLLQTKHPEVLDKSPWIYDWLKSNDEFLEALATFALNPAWDPHKAPAPRQKFPPQTAKNPELS